MTQGIYIDKEIPLEDGKVATGYSRRPKSKKEINTLLQNDQAHLVIAEATSLFASSNEYSGPISDMPHNRTLTYVGPDPYTSRKFYGNIVWSEKKGQWRGK